MEEEDEEAEFIVNRIRNEMSDTITWDLVEFHTSRTLPFRHWWRTSRRVI